MTLMFLNGGAMRGGPLHDLLRGARFVRVARTAPRYRFYSVGDRFPALAELAGSQNEITGPQDESADALGESADVLGEITGPRYRDGGVSVAGELYDVPWESLRESLLPAEPDELELGVIELEDGSGTLAMVRRRSYAQLAGEYRDISDYGDWRAYQAARAAETVQAAQAAAGSSLGGSGSAGEAGGLDGDVR